MPRYTLTTDETLFIQQILLELDEWFLSADASDPINNRAKANHRGMTIKEWSQAHRDLFNFVLLNNGKNVRASDFSQSWRNAIEIIKESLDLALIQGRWDSGRELDRNLSSKVTALYQ